MNKWRHETEADRKKRKLEEGSEGKMTKPSNDAVYLRRDTMEAFKRSDEKMGSYSRRADEKMESYSRKADEKMENFSGKADEMMESFCRSRVHLEIKSTG